MPTLLFQGESLSLFRTLQRRLAGSTHQGGVSPKEAETLLQETAALAVRAPYQTAEAWLIRQVESPLGEWLVVDRIEGLDVPLPRVTVGRSDYYRGLPGRLRRKHRIKSMETYGFHPPFVTTTVTARDDKAAYVVAAERFAESGAILDLIDRRRLGEGSYYALRSDGAGKFSFTREGWIMGIHGLDANGRLAPPYLQLSRAARREEAERSDWERRVLAACRWCSLSARSPWPADRLVSLMVALESLFLEGSKVRHNKGHEIAKQVTKRLLLRDMTQGEQETWMRGLYQRRNDAVHEGREYEEDLEVERLSDLANYATLWAAYHLVPSHRPSRRSCRTFAAAMRCGS
jgi:hypothetical protein